MSLVDFLCNYRRLREVLTEALETTNSLWRYCFGSAEARTLVLLKLQHRPQFERLLADHPSIVKFLIYGESIHFSEIVCPSFDFSTPGRALVTLAFGVHLADRVQAGSVFTREFIIESLCLPVWRKALATHSGSQSSGCQEGEKVTSSQEKVSTQVAVPQVPPRSDSLPKATAERNLDFQCLQTNLPEKLEEVWEQRRQEEAQKVPQTVKCQTPKQDPPPHQTHRRSCSLVQNLELRRMGSLDTIPESESEMSSPETPSEEEIIPSPMDGEEELVTSPLEALMMMTEAAAQYQAGEIPTEIQTPARKRGRKVMAVKE